MTAQKNVRKNIEKITWIGLGANVGLSLVKLIMGIAGNSQAVVADALHSFSDTASDLVVLLGVRYWTAPPDECHPFGHQKIESFVTIFIGLILLLVAGGIGYNAIVSLMHPVEALLRPMVVLAPVLSVVVKEVLFRITHRAGMENRSSSLKANAWHHRADALSSIPVLVAVIACLINPKLAFLDPVGAILVSVFIMKIGLEILWKSIAELVDAGMSRQQMAKILSIIQNTPHVRGVHSFRSRKTGSSYYIDLHLEVDGCLTVQQGHTIAEAVKEKLLQKNRHIMDVMVHLEPAD
ncbi:MAG: cation diffusion facilitator family transporter [Desulfotignum sp.]|nr:cation diffusion facilitator family transporter [Desulfobacteraceae bacterium]